MLKAKVKCNTVKKFVGGEMAECYPVTDDSAENKTYSMYTPNGRLELTITNPDAFGYFEPGKEYYLDIQKAE